MSFIITKHNSLTYVYKNHCYQIYKPKVKNHLKNALNRVFILCETMLSHYQRVFVVRVDLHPRQYSPTNKGIGLYLQAEKAKLQKLYNCKVAYFCTREQVSSSIEHYHVVFMLSGHKIQHPSRLVDSLSISWQEFSGGTLRKVKRSYGTMTRGNKASIDPIIYRISYLTKEHSKELNGIAKNFISSRLKPKLAIHKHNELLLVDPQTTFAKNYKKLLFIKTCHQLSKNHNKTSQKHGWLKMSELPVSLHAITHSNAQTEDNHQLAFKHGQITPKE